MNDMTIRPARLEDFGAIRRIYDHHAKTGFGTFDTEAPAQEVMVERFEAITSRAMPYLVAVVGGAVQGYAYAAPFRDRPAYRYTVEDSIYIAPDRIGRGVGRRLLGALIDTARSSGFRQMVAVIGDSENAASIGLHRSCGFEPRGSFQAVGTKLGRTLDIVFMQRAL